MRYDPVSLRLFIAVSQVGSISAAAAKVGLALAAASRRVIQLEDDAGAPLLERQARGVSLTPAGAALLHHAHSIVDAIERLRSDMSAYGSGERGSVRVFANTSSVLQFLPRDLRDFMQAHPALRIDLEERTSEEVARALRDGTAEVGIFDTLGAGPQPGLQTRPYQRDHLVLLVPADHRLARRKSVAFEEILDEDFVATRAGTALRNRLTEEALRRDKSLNVRIQVKGFDGLARMVEARVGIGVLPAATIDPLPRGLRRIPLRDAWAERLHCIGWRESAPMSRAAHLFVDFLTARAGEPPRSA